jgi:hypothetical protein
MRFHRRRAIAIINSGAMACPYSYFLTYGSNDRFWPQIPEMVLQPDIRASKVGVARSMNVPKIVLQRRERRARLAELAALRLSGGAALGGAALVVEPSNSDDSAVGADASVADDGGPMVADEPTIGASTSPFGESISDAPTFPIVDTTLDVNLDDSAWEDEAEEGPLSHSSAAGYFQRRRAQRIRHLDHPSRRRRHLASRFGRAVRGGYRHRDCRVLFQHRRSQEEECPKHPASSPPWG